jgi:uncharacterized protein YaaN involved in tellurite resistance
MKGELNVNDEVKPSTELTLAGAGQSAGQVVATRPEFIEDAEDAQLRKEAQELAQSVLQNPTDVSVTMEVYRIGGDLMKANTEQVALMETKIGAVLQEIKEGNPTTKTLTEIKTNLDLVNPSIVAKTEVTIPRKVLGGLITWTAKYLPKGDQVLRIINERRDSIATTIGGLQKHLWSGRDQALNNAVQLGNITDRLFETRQDLLRAIYSGQLLWAALNEGRALETDPARAQSLQTIVNDLSVQVVDLQTVDAVNTQSRMAAEVLIGNCQKIVQGVNRVTNVLLPAVSTNLAVKAAARQQLELVKAVQEISRAAEQTIVDTAKDTRAAVVSMQKMMSEGLINPAALETACKEFVTMVDEIAQIQKETEGKARATSRALATVADTMRRTADPMTKARQARQALDAGKEK